MTSVVRMGDRSPDSADRARWLIHGRVPVSIAIVLIIVSSGPHIRRSLDPRLFTGDVRQQVSPFLRFHDPELLRGDPVADYALQCLPAGYQAVYRVTAPVVDPRVTSKVIPYLIFGPLLAGIWVACRAIGGREAAWLGVFIAIAMGMPLESMSGGLPSGFSLVVFALGTAALVTRRPWWLAAATVAGGRPFI